MSMECRLANPEEWDDMIDHCPDSSYFHTRNWIKIWGDILPESKAICYLFRFDDGQKIIVPGLQKKLFKNILTRFDTSVEGTYGGLLSDQKMDQSKQEIVLKSLSKKGSFYLRQCKNETYETNDSLQFIENTFVLSLERWQEMNKNYSQSIYENITKATNKGIVVRESDHQQDWLRYVDLYKESANRWNKSSESLYPDVLFEKIRQEDLHTRKLWLAFYDEEAVYGCLVFYHKQTAYYWHGAGNDFALKYGAPSLLHDRIIRNLKTDGFLNYDMMPNGGKMSLGDFKSRFKPELIPVYGINYKTFRYKLFEGISYWKHTFFK